MKKLRPYESALVILGLLFLIGFFSVFPLGPSMVFAQNDADLFEELEQSIPKAKSPHQTPDNGSKNGPSDKSDKALFDELENKNPPLLTPSSDAWMAKLGENFEGSLRLRYSSFLNTPGEQTVTDRNSHAGEALFRFATGSGSDDFKIKVSGWAEAGIDKNNYQGVSHWPQDRSNDRRHLELNEVYAVISGDTADITIGKKLFKTGICTLFSPSDRFRPMDLTDPLDPKQFGIWQARADYYPGDHALTLAILPVYTDKKVPSPDSRWWGLFANDPFIGQIQKEDPDISLENVTYFARYKTTRKGWDFFMSTHFGPSPYSVVKLEGLTPKEDIISVFTLAGGFSTTRGNFEIHGESLYNLSREDKDQDYVSSVFGFTYTFGETAGRVHMEEIVLTLEYAGEIILDQQRADTYIISSQEGRPGANDFLSKILLKYDENLAFENLFHYEISDKAWMNRFEVSYRFGAGWTGTCAVELFGGKENLVPDAGRINFDTISYAQWKENDRLVVCLTYEF
ncbi:MAG: hypothetical protein KKF12_07405 [Proteobacteria bacterium]|nr:hypothetical protein [Desulfobacula sp.]MBU4130630.1 hypothetical protein [Pseudomonadota bacterium]